jgi:elongation factor 3
MCPKIEALIDTITDAHKKTPPGPRTDALNAVGLIIQSETKFQSIESYIITKILPIIIDRMDDKPAVIEIAQKVGLEIIAKLSIQAFPMVLPIFFASMAVESKWRAKFAATILLNAYLKRVDEMDRDLLSVSLPAIIPPLRDMLHDTKEEVATIAKETLLVAMRGVTNRDLEPYIEDFVRAMCDLDETAETIQRLAGVVFVQTVEGSALAVIVPLMIAGFRQPMSQVKRMCARIVSNMAQLVEDPQEAAPFLTDLIPALHGAIDTIPDPEARDVATKTHDLLSSIADKAKSLSSNHDMIATYIDEIISSEHTIITAITQSLLSTKTIEEDEYKNELLPYLEAIPENDAVAALNLIYNKATTLINIAAATDVADDDDPAEDLCDCEFTLAYGTKILLHNANMRLKKGKKYGLLGQNDSGKTTLMRAIADGSVDGFPDHTDVKTVFVEADIQGELSHLNCVDYVMESPAIKGAKITNAMVRNVLCQVGFSEGKASGAGGDCDDMISSLSGGWRMKLALARAMLQKADILLMDEPTNHLDVKNVRWVKDYINSLTDTTVLMVSHDAGLLDDCCNYIIQIDKLKLKFHRGNLSSFVKLHPEANSFFEYKANKFKFTFPQPGFLEGVKSRGKVLMKMDKVDFMYPGNTENTIRNISIKASMASRVACVGVNGAGKSTMIKVLTGELEPTTGTVWTYPNSHIGYIAQHAFHHIENHLNKTPNEYIRWRFQFGDDREGLDKASMKLSETDEEELAKPVTFTWKTESGAVKSEQRIISRCSGQRRESENNKKVYEYEVLWRGKSIDASTWYKEADLLKFHKIYTKIIRMIDQKIANQANLFTRPLTNENVEKHLNNVGLEPEYASHFRINALSGGQKVKVVLAAAMWDQPHILILDEPTNYLDRDSLGALADAIEKYEGGVIMITHNDSFCRQLCPERWVLEAGELNTEGNVDWMVQAEKQAVGFEQITEMIDATGNEVVLKQRKKLNAKGKKKMMATIKKKIDENEDLDSEEEDYAVEWNL